MTDNKRGIAVCADDGAWVVVFGDVTDHGRGSGVQSHSEGLVTVFGDVTDNDDGSAVVAMLGGQTIIDGNVYKEGTGEAVVARREGLVQVSGDVTNNGDDVAVDAEDDSIVIVEGTAHGGVNIIGGSEFYLGEISDDTVLKGDTADATYLLIGTGDASDVQWGDGITAGGNAYGGELAYGTASGKEYGTTISVGDCYAASEDLELTISVSKGKITEVSGLPSGVTAKGNDDGSYSLIVSDTTQFSGGLTELIIRLLKENPALAAALLDNTIYFDAANYDMETGNITVTGADADAVTAYNQADHAGVTFAASCLKADGANDIRVFNGEEELSSKDFSCHFHQDGSVSLIISNTYLLTRGAGAYNFRAFVNGVEAAFDLVAIC